MFATGTLSYYVPTNFSDSSQIYLEYRLLPFLHWAVKTTPAGETEKFVTSRCIR